MRVGESFPRQTTARVIAAANQDLEACVQERTLREDLFYRLRGVCIDMPSLAERREDIPLLVEHFLSIYGQADQPTTLSEDVMRAFAAYDWPGNVRELEMVVRGLAVHAAGREVVLHDLPSSIPPPPAKSLADVRPLEEVRKDHFLKAFRVFGHVGRTAKALGVSERTVRRVLAEIKAQTVMSEEPFMPLQDVLAVYAAEVIKLTEGNRSRAAEVLGVAFTTLVKYEVRAREIGIEWQDLCQSLRLPDCLNSIMAESTTESHTPRGPSSEPGSNHDRI